MLLIKRSCSNFQRLSTIFKLNKPGEQIQIQGWIKNIRRLKNHIFLDFNDGSTNQKFQVVVPKTESNTAIATGSSIKASGVIQVAPNGNYELHADNVNVIANGNNAQGYPFITKQQHPPEYVRDFLHLRTRVDFVAAQMRVRHKAIKALHDFMDEQGFVQINTPILTTNDCEGAGEVFCVHPNNPKLLKEMQRQGIPVEQSYFDSKVYLSVSGQLHLESASYGLGNTYTLSAAFRAENCKSPLHLSEFYMFEAELAFCDELEELTTFIEKMIKTTTKNIIATSIDDIHTCQKKALGATNDLAWLETKWKTLSYDEAVKIIEENKDKIKTELKLEEGFSKEQEIFLVDYCGAPVFIVDWPLDQKPFYMKVSRSNPLRVHALDLLMPTVGELCGGSLRETDINILAQHPSYPKGLDWYLELRKYGGIPTGGFGMGFDRYLQLLTGVKNIRDVIPFPRYPHSCKM